MQKVQTISTRSKLKGFKMSKCINTSKKHSNKSIRKEDPVVLKNHIFCLKTPKTKPKIPFWCKVRNEKQATEGQNATYIFRQKIYLLVAHKN